MPPQRQVANVPKTEAFSRVEPGDNLQSIPELTLTEYEDQKLKLVGRIVRISFSMRDSDPSITSDGLVEARLHDDTISDVAVRFPRERIEWFTTIVPWLDHARGDQTRGRVPFAMSVHGKVAIAQRGGIVLDLLGEEIFRNMSGPPQLIWR
jgi:hypothetical protein